MRRRSSLFLVSLLIASLAGSADGGDGLSSASPLPDAAFAATIDIAIDPTAPTRKHPIILHTSRQASELVLLTLPQHGSLWVGSTEIQSVPHAFTGREVFFQPRGLQVLYEADRFDFEPRTGAAATVFLHFVEEKGVPDHTGLPALTEIHWTSPAYFKVTDRERAILNWGYPGGYQAYVDRYYRGYAATVSTYLANRSFRRADIPALFEYYYFVLARSDSERSHHLLRLARLLDGWTGYVADRIAAPAIFQTSYMDIFHMLRVFVELEGDASLEAFYDRELDRTTHPNLPSTFASLKAKVVQAMVALDKNVPYYEAGFHNRVLEGLAIRTILARLDPRAKRHLTKISDFPLLEDDPPKTNPPVTLETYLERNLQAWLGDPTRRDIVAGSEGYAAHTLECLLLLLRGSPFGAQLAADRKIHGVFGRYLDQVTHLGFVPHYGDGMGTVSSLAWISIFEQAAELTRDRRFKRAAFDLFRWVVLRGDDVRAWGNPVSDLAVQSIFAHLSHRRFPEAAPDLRFESRQTRRQGTRLASARCSHHDHRERIICENFVEFDATRGLVPDSLILEQVDPTRLGLYERHERGFVDHLRSMSAFVNLGESHIGHGHCATGSLDHLGANDSVLLQAPSYMFKDYAFHNVFLFEAGARRDLADDRWHHVVARLARRGSGQGHLTLYVDGLRVADRPTAAGRFIDVDHRDQNGNVHRNSGRIKLGGRGKRYFDGLIDNVRIYDRALTPEEIFLLYGRGKGRSLDGGSGIPNLVALFDGKVLAAQNDSSIELVRWHKDASRQTFPKVNIDGAYEFDGTANVLILPNYSKELDLTGKSELTVSLWFRAHRRPQTPPPRDLPLIDASPFPEGGSPYHFGLQLTEGRPGFKVNGGLPAREILTSPRACVQNGSTARVSLVALDRHPLVDYAKIRIENHQAQHATLTRNLMMVRDRFLLVVDDLAAAADLHQASGGPVWQAQTVYGPLGPDFVNVTVQKMGIAWFVEPRNLMQWRNNPYDLLIYSPGGKVRIDPVSHVLDASLSGKIHFNTNRLRAGFFERVDLKKGEHQSFVTFLVPHAPTEDPRRIVRQIKPLASNKGQVVYQVGELRVGWRLDGAPPFRQPDVDSAATVFVTDGVSLWTYSRSATGEEHAQGRATGAQRSGRGPLWTAPACPTPAR